MDYLFDLLAVFAGAYRPLETFAGVHWALLDLECVNLVGCEAGLPDSIKPLRNVPYHTYVTPCVLWAFGELVIGA